MSVFSTYLNLYIFSGHPLLSAASNQSPEIIEEKNENLNLYEPVAATFWPSQRDFSHCCHLHPLSGHQALDTLSLTSCLMNMMKENSPR